MQFKDPDNAFVGAQYDPLLPFAQPVRAGFMHLVAHMDGGCLDHAACCPCMKKPESPERAADL